MKQSNEQCYNIMKLNTTMVLDRPPQFSKPEISNNTSKEQKQWSREQKNQNVHRNVVSLDASSDIK